MLYLIYSVFVLNFYNEISRLSEIGKNMISAMFVMKLIFSRCSHDLEI
jgi:hypothetical protein